MGWERIAENRIREAMHQGKFDNLAGVGKPIDLEGYFKLPEHLRVAFSLLKSANCVPAEVELRNEIAGLEQQLSDAAGEQEPIIRRALAERRLQVAVVLERSRRT
jgi:DNA polymerase/3'-5' exonuclease PolX